MKWLNRYRIRLVLAGFVAAILAGGAGRVYGDFTFGEPVKLGPILNTAYGETIDSISSDGLGLYFASWHKNKGWPSGDCQPLRFFSKSSRRGQMISRRRRIDLDQRVLRACDRTTSSVTAAQ